MSSRADTDTSDGTCDVVVVGGGPAGGATAWWLASRGHRVVVVERRVFPRSKACGDVLSPRAVHQVAAMGIDLDGIGAHRLDTISVLGGSRRRELAWPHRIGEPAFGVSVRRRDLDRSVLEHAVAAGAHVLAGHEAVEPVVERGFVRGAVVRGPTGRTREIRSTYVVVADGANSTFGRTLGTLRTRDWPFAASIRSYWQSDRHGESTVEMRLGLTDRQGAPVPGYGWVAPLGDGTLNIGVGVLSTAHDFKGINVAHLLDAFVGELAERWHVDPAAATGVVRVGRVPMGLSVQPNAGPTSLVVGDAAGAASPFTGLGLDAAYETGRMAADVVHDALTESGPTALQRYPRLVRDAYGDGYKTARLWARVLGRPTAARQFAGLALRSRTVAEATARLATGTLRPDTVALPETIAKVSSLVLRAAPDA